MRKGKMVSQGAHASSEVVYREAKRGSKDLELWRQEGQTKITLGCEDKDELLELHQKALLANLPCALITDSGKTEFHGVPTLTALAIGPADSKEIDKISGDLVLL